ncbi:MAG TPA: alpha/beta hydrolase [Alphaproteobacteria bacterium]|nr:alpha/beta hydrolase [Alphaproteobacteria bacterium]
MNKKIIILHGTGGSPEGNWFPWLKEKLERHGNIVYVPKLPTPENQSLQNWLVAFYNQVPSLDENTILIGHSCGAAFILNILEKLNKPVKESVFVSGFINKLGNKYFDDLNETFIENNFDWERIKSNAGKITILYGDNDPYIPLKAAQRLAEKLKQPITIIKNGGHLNAEFGFTKFDELLNILI